MHLLPTSDLIVELISNKADELPFICLKHHISKQQVTLEGAYLEAQYRYGINYLIFTSNDCPFEERLSIYYLDESLKTLDALELGAIYTPGILDDLTIIYPNKLSFSFFDREEQWHLTIAEQGSFKPLFHTSSVRRKRPFYTKRWLDLKCTSS